MPSGRGVRARLVADGGVVVRDHLQIEGLAAVPAVLNQQFGVPLAQRRID